MAGAGCFYDVDDETEESGKPGACPTRTRFLGLF